jgi:hypothetical protein
MQCRSLPESSILILIAVPYHHAGAGDRGSSVQIANEQKSRALER